MGWIGAILERHREKIKHQNDLCNHLIEQMDTALEELNSIFTDQQSFVESGKEGEWHSRYSELIQTVANIHNRELRKASNFKELLGKQAELFRSSSTLKRRIAEHNDRIVEEKIQNAYALVGKVEGKALDRQQMDCIIKEAHNQLVVAGAGTGKTTTIIGKIRFSLQSGKCSPEDILVLSFTNA